MEEECNCVRSATVNEVFISEPNSILMFVSINLERQPNAGKCFNEGAPSGTKDTLWHVI